MKTALLVETVHGHEHVDGQRSRLRPNEPVERLHDAELLSIVSGRKLPDAAQLVLRVGLKAILRGEGMTRAQRRRLEAAHLGGRREERFHIVGLDCRNTVLGDACIAVGGVDSVQVDPREVFSRVLVGRVAALRRGSLPPIRGP